MVGITVVGVEGGAVWGGAVEEPVLAEDMIGDVGRGGGKGGRGGRGCRCERRETEERESAVVFGYSEFVFEFCDALVTRRARSEISESFY